MSAARRGRAGRRGHASLGSVGTSNRTNRDGDIDMTGDSIPSGPARFNPYGAGAAGAASKGSRSRRRGTNVDQASTRATQIDMTITGASGGSAEDLVSFIWRKLHIKVTNVRNTGGTTLVAVFSPQDAKILEKNSGLKFAGDVLRISQARGDSDISMAGTTSRGGSTGGRTAAKESTIDTLKQFLATRYQPETRMLDLSRMTDDPILKSIGLEANTSASSKMFPALMKVLQDDKLDVVSINLEGNRIKDVSGISSLAQTYPKLRNLSLAHNELRRYRDLDAWAAKTKLASLSELILVGNAVREDDIAKGREVEYRSEITKRFPSLKLLDGVAVSQGISFGVPDEEVAAAEKSAKLQIPIRREFYENESVQSTVNDFLGRFFMAYDSGDRSKLESVYAETGVFTMSLNVTAPRKKTGGAFTGSSWQAYIGTSRNLTRITQIDARIARTNIGRRQIIQALKHLPATRHDLTDASLFCVDAFTFQTSAGAPLIQVNVHGEFSERVNKQETRRSFDRTFVLGPAIDGGVEIKSDMLLLRAWGGSDAWRVSEPGTAGASNPSVPANAAIAPQINGVLNTTRPADGPDLATKQSLLQQLRQRTGLNENYAALCLEQMNFDLEASVRTTEELRARNGIPPEAFA
ncbi:nuclear mRNA export, poly(A)+RNA binding protein [Savitreella phatthalungensis]